MESNIGNLINFGGYSEVYDYGDNKVVKLYKRDNSEIHAYWEYRRLKNAWKNGIPVPYPYEYVKINNRYGIVMEKIEGRTLLDIIATFLECNTSLSNDALFYSPEILGRIKLIAKCIYDVHKISAKNMLILENIDTYVYKTILSCPILTKYEKEKLQYTYLNMQKNKSTICHGDLHFTNIIESNKNIVLIDWKNAVISDPEYDLAIYYRHIRWFLYIKKYNNKKHEILSNFIKKNNDMFIKEFLSEYVKISNIKLISLDLWVIIISLSFFDIKTVPDAYKKKELTEYTLNEIYTRLKRI